AVDGGAAAQHLAARIVDRAPAETRLDLGLEAPIRARVVHAVEIADGNMDPEIVVAPTGFEQQHADVRIRRQPVGKQTARRAAGDDDVVVDTKNGWGFLHGSTAPVRRHGDGDHSTMTQNIYDDPEFFESYSRLDRSVEGLAGAAEWPALRALLPDPRGLKVVDLGCGFGWVCRWTREQGAAEVLGLDVSERMLERARAMTSDAAIIYARADLERLDLRAASFDLAHSSLALHYINDLAGLLAIVHRAL